MEENKMIIKNESENLLSSKMKKNYCSIKPKTVEDKKLVYNALESADVLLNDVVGETILIKDYYCEEKQVFDEESGEIKNKYRTIFFDVDGKTYATGSYGIFNAVMRLTAIFGEPSWEDGIPVTVTKQKTQDGKSKLTLILE